MRRVVTRGSFQHWKRLTMGNFPAVIAAIAARRCDSLEADAATLRAIVRATSMVDDEHRINLARVAETLAQVAGRLDQWAGADRRTIDRAIQS
jgi:ABC-type transporter Mla subunit MlaD